MTKKFANLLLGVLWLLTVTLAATFWMNIKYGFNIFSAAHWAYLSEMQAYRTQIKLDFYISLIGAIIIGLTGLYFLLRPKLQTFFIEPSQMPPLPGNVDTPNILHHKSTNSNDSGITVANEPTPIKHEPESAPANIPHRPHATRPMSPMGTQRMVPNPKQNNNTNIIRTPTPKINSPEPTGPIHASDISDILEKSEYQIKPCMRIGKLIKPVVALSYDQTVWVCSENVSATDVTDALQTLVTVFDDTLGDSANDLTVRGCIINATDTPENSELIYTFDTLDEFGKFINSHPNTKPDDYDQELFDAISTYISTVTNYIGKQ